MTHFINVGIKQTMKAEPTQQPASVPTARADRRARLDAGWPEQSDQPCLRHTAVLPLKPMKFRASSNFKTIRTARARCSLAALVLLVTVEARADLPVSGRPVPALAALDRIMTDFMADPSRAI